MSLLPHLQCHPEQIAERVVVCGDPARVDRIAAQLDDVALLGQSREFRLANGRYRGRNITVCSTGIGAPSAIIALEELVQSGARQLVRVGSAGSLQPAVALGDLVVVEGAVRHDGASLAYLPAEYPACADLGLQQGLLAAVRATGHPLHHGLVRSHDAFYRDDEQAVCDLWHRRGILAADMESGALLAVGRYRRVRVAAVLCNVVAWQQEVQEGVADYAAAEARMMEAEQLAIRAALSALTN
ncbi:nucleoside phosphorylase [Aeromonas diversa]|uniref:nucleoside phosphorylase n=1 Tax=Aeromonas diversa TaxID=502790 RepID=UPI003462F44D